MSARPPADVVVARFTGPFGALRAKQARPSAHGTGVITARAQRS
ncbi:hypothetical protein [Saccharopolyspora montiporae]|nr:hypothetical protein [Saccharopolyspora sp. HNM0983]